MSCDHELANEWARCSGKNDSYITILVKRSPWVKTFQPITTVVNNDNKSFQFSPHRISMVFRLRTDFVERKIVDQLKINIYSYLKFW